jgi:hypothetical protein
VHWVVSTVFCVPPALGMLGVLQPPDPSVLLILILGASAIRSSADMSVSSSSSYSEPFVIRSAQGRHVDLKIRRVVSRMVVLE